MVLAKSTGGSLQVSCQTRPRRGAFLSPDKDQACGEIAVVPINAFREEKVAARSVGTRRSTRSSRGGVAENVVEVFRSRFLENKRPDCRVSHSTSPSRRESAPRANKCF